MGRYEGGGSGEEDGRIPYIELWQDPILNHGYVLVVIVAISLILREEFTSRITSAAVCVGKPRGS